MGLIEHKLRVFFRTFFPPMSVETARKGRAIALGAYLASTVCLFSWTLKLYFENYDDLKKTYRGRGLLQPPNESAKLQKGEHTIIYYQNFKEVGREVLTAEEAKEQQRLEAAAAAESRRAKM